VPQGQELKVKAIVRQELEKIPGVTRTWIEIEFEDNMQLNTLVVEVDFNTDANFSDFRPSTLDEIERVVKDTLKNRTTMVVSKLRVVPQAK
jgi:hypothetical protein